MRVLGPVGPTCRRLQSTADGLKPAWACPNAFAPTYTNIRLVYILASSETRQYGRSRREGQYRRLRERAVQPCPGDVPVRRLREVDAVPAHRRGRVRARRRRREAAERGGVEVVPAAAAAAGHQRRAAVEPCEESIS